MAAKKKVEPAKGKDSVGVWIAVSASIAVLLLGGVFWLRSRAKTMDRLLAESKQQYEEMKATKKKIKDLAARGGSAPKGDENPDGFAGYLSSAANQSGLPSSLMKFNPEGRKPVTIRGWQEWAVTVEHQAGKDTPIKRENFVDYLARVEREKPYLKPKNLTVAFSGSDFSRINVNFSYFKRD